MIITNSRKQSIRVLALLLLLLICTSMPFGMSSAGPVERYTIIYTIPAQ